jgi:Tfp pilus assembly protein PilO
MNKLSKEKRDRLLLACLGSVGLIAVLYFLIITDQKSEIAELNSKITALESKRSTSERLGKALATVQAEVEAQKKILAEKQEEMVRPDQDHVWLIRIMNTADLRSKYGIEVDSINAPEPTEAGILPKFPFKAVALSVSLLGNYTDVGRFLADFENRYPYLRLQMLSVAPEVRPRETTRPNEPRDTTTGQLRFNYRVIALLKSPL